MSESGDYWLGRTRREDNFPRDASMTPEWLRGWDAADSYQSASRSTNAATSAARATTPPWDEGAIALRQRALDHAVGLTRHFGVILPTDGKSVVRLAAEFEAYLLNGHKAGE